MTEILAPAGSEEMLEAALAAGCDAVYFALQRFGARASADNFTLESAKQAIQKCHLIGVKVHVTMNTVIYEDEMAEAYADAKALYEMGVDALIVQDIGFIHLLHERLPNLVIHASTQMSIMTSEQINKLKILGVKRVVLARECSLEQIHTLKRCGLEIEVFVHGAMCICFSGQCYFSSVRYARSGNRGRCAQPCRMPYDLLQDGKKLPVKGNYLLSPKDLSLIDKVDELDVDSLKIEGRMKSSAYVYEAVSQVKKALEHKKRTQEDRKNLMLTFNRGYTLGHTYDQKGYALMNTKTCNHQGILAGKIIGVHAHFIDIYLYEDLHQYDGIRFENGKGCRINYLYDSNHDLKNNICAGSTACIKRVPGVQKGSLVLKTVSYVLETKIHRTVAKTIRKVPVDLNVTCAGINQPLCAYADDGVHQVYVESDTLAQLAKNQSLQPQVIIKQFSKTKSSWIDFDIQCNVADGIYFPVGAVNALRRKTIKAMEEERIKASDMTEKEYDFRPNKQPEDIRLSIQKIDGNAAPSTMNITNSYAVAAALQMGYQKAYISDECTNDQISQMMRAFQKRYGFDAPVIKALYQKRKLMTMKHCPVNTELKDGSRENCVECHLHRFELQGKDKKRVLCKGNAHCFMELYEEQAEDHISDLPFYKDLGITNYYVHFIDESDSEKAFVLNRIKAQL